MVTSDVATDRSGPDRRQDSGRRTRHGDGRSGEIDGGLRSLDFGAKGGEKLDSMLASQQNMTKGNAAKEGNENSEGAQANSKQQNFDKNASSKADAPSDNDGQSAQN